MFTNYWFMVIHQPPLSTLTLSNSGTEIRALPLNISAAIYHINACICMYRSTTQSSYHDESSMIHKQREQGPEASATVSINPITSAFDHFTGQRNSVE
jgi:hypothetical protein